MKSIEYKAMGIKTPQGKRIYDAGVRRDGELQLAASKAKTERERDRLLAKGRKAYSEALAAALALNPENKLVKKKLVSVSLKRRRR